MHVHLVSVKVGIVRTGGRDVQAECRVGQNTHAMGHHRCLVERRLTVEQHNVAVNQMAVDHIALTNINRIRTDEAKVHHAGILLEEHRLGTRMRIGTVANVRGQTVAIVRVHNLGEGQVHGNLGRHTKLVQVNVRIGRDDRTGREVDTLSHQVSADTPCLGTEARLERPQGASRPLSSGSQSLDVIVHIRGNIILHHGGILVNHLGRLALVELVTQTLIVAKNVNQLVRQVILHSLVVVHHNRRTHRQRRDGQDRADHPLGPRILVVEPNQVARMVRNTLESPQNQLDLNRNRRRRIIGVSDRESLQRGRLACHTSDLPEERRRAMLADRRLLEALRSDLGHDVANLLEPSESGRLDIRQLARAKNHARTVQADDVAQLLNPIEELVEIHRPSKRDVSEVTRAELIRVLTCRADLAILNDTEANVKDAVRDGLL